MTLDDRLRRSIQSERFGATPPDLQGLREQARERERNRHRVYAGMAVLALAVFATSAVVVATRSDEPRNEDVVAGPVEQRAAETGRGLGPVLGVGPGTAPNVTQPAGGPEQLAPSRWLAARMGVRDTQLVIAYNGGIGCPVVSRASTTYFEDRVEVGLYLLNQTAVPGGSVCSILGPPHVAIELTEPLAGRPVYDVAEPGVERVVLDGAGLQVPMPASMSLAEERLLPDPRGFASWMQTFQVPGGTVAIAQGDRTGVLGAVGIDASDVRPAPRTLEGAEPLSVLEEPYGVHGGPALAVVYGIREYGPLDVGVFWQEDGRHFALRYRSTQGTPALHDIILIAHTMTARGEPPNETLPLLAYAPPGQATGAGAWVELRSPCPQANMITTVDETTETVTVTIRCTYRRFGTDLMRVFVPLDEPVGERVVIDGTTGQPLPALE
jgi:hypothetical protein